MDNMIINTSRKLVAETLQNIVFQKYVGALLDDTTLAALRDDIVSTFPDANRFMYDEIKREFKFGISENKFVMKL